MMMTTTSSSSSAATNMDMSESVKEVVPELPIHHRLDRSGYFNAGKQNVSFRVFKEYARIQGMEQWYKYGPNRQLRPNHQQEEPGPYYPVFRLACCVLIKLMSQLMGSNEEPKDPILAAKKNGSIDVVPWFRSCPGGEGLDHYRTGERFAMQQVFCSYEKPIQIPTPKPFGL